MPIAQNVSSNLCLIRNCVPQSSLHSLFVCLVTPSLDYCCTVWGGRYIYHDNILNKCLKRAARIILQYAFLTPSADMFSKLNWLSFSERVKYRKSTLVFKSVNRMTPRYMTNLFTPLTHFRETNNQTRMALTISSFLERVLQWFIGTCSTIRTTSFGTSPCVPSRVNMRHVRAICLLQKCLVNCLVNAINK